jgi:hypothetical protein
MFTIERLHRMLAASGLAGAMRRHRHISGFDLLPGTIGFVVYPLKEFNLRLMYPLE